MDQTEFISNLREIYAQLVVDFLEFLPKLLGALGVLVVGYLLAHLLRLLIRRLLENIDRLLPSQLSRRAIQRLGDRHSFAELVSRVVFWFVVFISLTVATEVVDLKVVSTWLSGLTTYLPQLLAAVLVGFVGIAAGKIVREMISRFSQTVGVGQPQALGRTAQVVILIATGIIVAGQIGIEVVFLTQLAVIVVASVLGGAALAFGLGSRTLVTNILAAHYLRQQYRVGQTVKISGNEGRIVEITSTAVILQGKDGRVMVPAKEFEEVASVLLSRRR
jgi:small-conductance mechanosensitive channel